MAQYAMQFLTISDFLLFNVDYCDINKENINGWAKEVRNLLWEIRLLRDDPDLDISLVPYEDVREVLGDVLVNFSLAKGILRHESVMEYKPKEFYHIFIDCSILLSNAAELLFNASFIAEQEETEESLESTFDEDNKQMS